MRMLHRLYLHCTGPHVLILRKKGQINITQIDKLNIAKTHTGHRNTVHNFCTSPPKNEN